MNNIERILYKRKLVTSSSFMNLFYKAEFSMKQLLHHTLQCCMYRKHHLMDPSKIHIRKAEGIVNIIDEKREPISRPAISEIGSYFSNRNPN